MEENTKKRSLKKEIIEFLIVIAVMLFLFNYVLMSVKVSGSSMEPSYYDGERGIMVRQLPFYKPNYNDVVVIDTGNELIVKRVIAMPNDTIEIKENVVYVNGQKIDDSHRNPNTRMSNYILRKLENDEIFVLGDNRNVSKDSRSIGPVKLSQVKALDGFIYWPLNKISLFK